MKLKIIVIWSTDIRKWAYLEHYTSFYSSDQSRVNRQYLA